MGYDRCSTEEQSKGDYSTLESQKDYIRSYIQAVHPDWEVVGFYEDGSYSGKDTNRPGLQSLLADCQKGKFDVVVTYKLDRITRSLADFFDLDRIFERYGVSFISVKEQFDTSTAMGRAMRNIAFTFAELEREMVAERTKDKMTAMVRQGKWPGGNVPFGHDVRDGKLLPSEVEAPALRMMFETYIETKSLAAVRDKLLAYGVKTKGIKFRGGLKPRISDWNKQKISYILQNRVYLGELNYDGIRVPKTHEPLISQELFDIVQGIIAEGVRGRPNLNVDHDYILAGKVICGYCGCRLTPKSTNHPRRKKSYTAYYECYRLSKYKGFYCEVRRMNADALEELFLETLKRLSWDEAEMAKAAAIQAVTSPDEAERRDKEAALADRLLEVDKKIGNIIKAVEDGLAGTSVQARLQELERQRAVLQSEIARIRLDLDQAKPEPIDIRDAMSVFKECSELFQEITLDEKEKLVDAILKSATVDKDKAVEFEFYVGEDTSNVVQNVKVGSPNYPIDRTFRAVFEFAERNAEPKKNEGKPSRLYRNPIHLAREWQAMLDSGQYESAASLAHAFDISRARVAQLLRLLRLSPEVLAALVSLGDPLPCPMITERSLRPLVKLRPDEQRVRVRQLAAMSEPRPH